MKTIGADMKRYKLALTMNVLIFASKYHNIKKVASAFLFIRVHSLKL